MVMGLGLRAHHAEVADVYRLCRIAQVVDLEVIAAHPSFLRVVGDEIRDAGVAFPPALVRAGQVVDDRCQLARLRRHRDIPDFMCAATKRAQQVPLAFHAARQRVAAADAHHLRSAGAPVFTGGNVREVFRVRGVGHVDDRRAAHFQFPGERIHERLLVVVVTDVGDLPAVLADDERLVGGSSLEVVMANSLHVPLRRAIPRTDSGRRRGWRRSSSGQRHQRNRRSIWWVRRLCDGRREQQRGEQARREQVQTQISWAHRFSLFPDQNRNTTSNCVDRDVCWLSCTR